MTTDTNIITDTSPLKKQNEFSLGDQETKVEKPKFKYMEPCFVEAVADFLKPESTLTKNAVAQKGDKHFDRYSDELITISKIVGQPENIKNIPSKQRAEVLDIIRCSNVPKPLRFFANELWNLDFQKDALKAGGANQALASKSPQTGLDYDRKDSCVQKLKTLLKGHNEEKQLSADQLDSLIDSLTQSTEQAAAQSRRYLTGMLYIGAALIFFRFQCALLDKADAQALHGRLLSALNRHFNKSTRTALDATLGRIRRAYIKTIAYHLEEPEPDLKDKKDLWSLYTRSIEEIPILVERYFEGNLNDSYLTGIPYLPTVPGKRKVKSSKEPPEWALHIKSLKSLFEATDPGSNDKKHFDGGFVDATMFSLERLTNILSKQEPSTLHGCKQSIQEQIERLESLIVHEA
ncbi:MULTISPECIES: hypothetical protein [unclassified Lentimonas]|uniref:hypothetical protein n=1 Tax=unclassified Lentimonas TaxID=2630993 RepID=UPI0013287C0A|nr:MULTISPECIES: hypothetical protein [unclassified Lentimonas]CAA6679313.1 Unannotated [Lentimonas sp. CC4]CAA6686350.1 Unannotated [Lentimonas sp. CC6]CAA7076124.1 Unannotated [Lentimonas sp. CC4]CAA7170883.1 Unannotated [Lentimonas sp. CC21]CAA7181175.1 Unannotated [Lentimonas sp. CC8]